MMIIFDDFDTQMTCEEFYSDDAELDYKEEDEIEALFNEMLYYNHDEIEEMIGDDPSTEWVAFCIRAMWKHLTGRDPMEIKALALKVGEHYNDEP